ncbi:hypothetical protein DKX38_017635 [Salix brachista]|uniref:Uncharacterized protein n=1 Tax=Salix brachista TaxID=2182728 RepID=A0A5N5KVU4_9ROSI|nr:hypothetical protein DKX38_017635 [Salix brachista]
MGRKKIYSKRLRNETKGEENAFLVLESYLYDYRKQVSAICDLSIANKGLDSRMWNVAMAITVYGIWHERNSRVFEKNRSSVDVIFQKFQILLYTIYHFHVQDPSLLNVG